MKRFSKFHVAFVIKRLWCIEFRMFGKKEKKKLEVQKWPRQATAHFRVWVVTEISLSRQSFLALCRDMALYVMTWFLGYRGGWVVTGVFLVATELCLAGFL